MAKKMKEVLKADLKPEQVKAVEAYLQAHTQLRKLEEMGTPHEEEKAKLKIELQKIYEEIDPEENIKIIWDDDIRINVSLVETNKMEINDLFKLRKFMDKFPLLFKKVSISPNMEVFDGLSEEDKNEVKKFISSNSYFKVEVN